MHEAALDLKQKLAINGGKIEVQLIDSAQIKTTRLLQAKSTKDMASTCKRGQVRPYQQQIRDLSNK